jgi:hypothetical protein
MKRAHVVVVERVLAVEDQHARVRGLAARPFIVRHELVLLNPVLEFGMSYRWYW